uniref:Uncharacterized protein n=1 Tax=Arundo donax TaxID=35708 RepID=A0A0A9HMH5_ARUDO
MTTIFRLVYFSISYMISP